MSKAHCGGEGCEKDPYSSDSCDCACERCVDETVRLEIKLQERDARIKDLELQAEKLRAESADYKSSADLWATRWSRLKDNFEKLDLQVKELQIKLENAESVNADYLQMCKQRDQEMQFLLEREEVIRKLKETVEAAVKVLLEHELKGLVKPKEPKYVFCLEHRRVMTDNKCPACEEKRKP